MLFRPRQLDLIDPDIRRQHQANQALGAMDDEARRRQEEAERVLEKSVESVHD